MRERCAAGVGRSADGGRHPASRRHREGSRAPNVQKDIGRHTDCGTIPTADKHILPFKRYPHRIPKGPFFRLEVNRNRREPVVRRPPHAYNEREVGQRHVADFLDGNENVRCRTANDERSETRESHGVFPVITPARTRFRNAELDAVAVHRLVNGQGVDDLPARVEGEGADILVCVDCGGTVRLMDLLYGGQKSLSSIFGAIKQREDRPLGPVLPT